MAGEKGGSKAGGKIQGGSKFGGKITHGIKMAGTKWREKKGGRKMAGEKKREQFTAKQIYTINAKNGGNQNMRGAG